MNRFFMIIFSIFGYGWLWGAGKAGQIERKMMENPEVAFQTCMAAADEEAGNAKKYADSTARQMTLQEGRGQRIKSLRESIQRLTQRIKSFEAMREAMIEKKLSTGMTEEQLKTDLEFVTLSKNWQDDNSTLEAQKADLANTEAEYKEREQEISEMQVTLQEMVNKARKYREKAEDLRSKLLSAKSQLAADESRASLSTNTMAAKVDALDQVVKDVTNRAKVTKKLADIQTGTVDSRITREAENAAAMSSFLSSSKTLQARRTTTVPAATEAPAAAKLPE